MISFCLTQQLSDGSKKTNRIRRSLVRSILNLHRTDYMELIVIDESRIKLSLTSADISAYGVSSAECVTPALLRGIISDVRQKFGCGSLDGRIYIQMYPSKGGGCELFVTKLGERKKSVTMKAGNESILAEYRKYVFRGRVIYSFDEMAGLLRTCRDLESSGYDERSSAYYDETRHIYYLILECETHSAGENLGSLCRSASYYYITEHCRMLSDKAVERLAEFAT